MARQIHINEEQITALGATLFAAETMLHLNPRIDPATRRLYLQQTDTVRNWMHDNQIKEKPDAIPNPALPVG